MQAKPTAQNAQPSATEVRPYTRSRPVGQTGKEDSTVDQAEMRAAPEPSGINNTSSPAVYVRGQKRKVSGRLQLFCLILSLSLHSNHRFPSGPGLAGSRISPIWILSELRVMEGVVISSAIRRAKLQSKCHHQQTNTQFLLGLGND